MCVGVWTDLPELNPLRAQHGCALVELGGRRGVLVVGGDSGGTRLKDVRFLGLEADKTEWVRVGELNTARWGRPSVGIIGGKITGRGTTYSLKTIRVGVKKKHLLLFNFVRIFFPIVSWNSDNFWDKNLVIVSEDKQATCYLQR